MAPGQMRQQHSSGHGARRAHKTDVYDWTKRSSSADYLFTVQRFQPRAISLRRFISGVSLSALEPYAGDTTSTR